MSEDEKYIIRNRSKNRYHENKRIKKLVNKILREEMLSKYNLKDE